MRRKLSRKYNRIGSRKSRMRARATLDIKRCYSCRDGRLMRHNDLVFCGFCGKEFPRLKF